MARSGKKFCLLLDTEKVLSTDELLELPDSAEQADGNSQSEPEVPAAPILDLSAITATPEETENE